MSALAYRNAAALRAGPASTPADDEGPDVAELFDGLPHATQVELLLAFIDRRQCIVGKFMWQRTDHFGTHGCVETDLSADFWSWVADRKEVQPWEPQE